MRNGEAVGAFEREFAAYVGAKYAIALCNGTATLHTALVALGVKSGDRVAVPPLTMSATTIAVLQAGVVPVFVDVDPDTWLARCDDEATLCALAAAIPVSLYGLHSDWSGAAVVDDAAQTLRTARPFPLSGTFTSYSFQASKILPLGEGGMLVTDDEELAVRAREFSSLGYRMRADQPRIDPKVLKSPTFARHHSLGFNYRMNDLTAEKGLQWLQRHSWTRDAGDDHGDTNDADLALENRRLAASYYRKVIKGCDWLTPQYVPDGWTHDYWTYAVATDTPERLLALLDAVERHGGERPYPAWRLTYNEPAFRHLPPTPSLDKLTYEHVTGGEWFGICLVAESLQPRLAQFQTNNLASAERNAKALKRAIEELS